MKKIKYFMPALAVASIASAVTPMVTSCSKNNSQTWTFNYIENAKISKYKPIYEPLKKEKVKTLNDLNKKYYDEVSTNPEILVDDLFNTYSIIVQQNPERFKEMYKNYSLSVSDISTKYYTMYQDEDPMLVVFYNLTITTNWDLIDSDTGKVVGNEKAIVKYQNAPFIFEDYETELKCYRASSEILRACLNRTHVFNTAILFDYTYTDAKTSEQQHVEFVVNDNYGVSLMQESFSTYYNYFIGKITIYSQYLSKITVEEE